MLQRGEAAGANSRQSGWGGNVWSQTSQAQKLSRQGMTHAHLLNLTLLWRLPVLLATVIFFSLLSSSPGLSTKGTGEAPGTCRPQTLPVSTTCYPGPGSLVPVCLFLEFQLEVENQASSLKARQGTEKGSLRGRGDKIRFQDKGSG